MTLSQPGDTVQTEQTFPSTTWEWRRVKIRRAPEAPANQRGEAAPPSPLVQRNPRDPLTLTLKLRGGAECWCEVQTRGRTFRYPGATAIYDIVEDINRRR